MADPVLPKWDYLTDLPPKLHENEINTPEGVWIGAAPLNPPIQTSVFLEVSEIVFSVKQRYGENAAVAYPGGGAEGAMAPPGPVKIGHKKDGHRRRPHRFHVSRPPPLPGRWIRYCAA